MTYAIIGVLVGVCGILIAVIASKNSKIKIQSFTQKTQAETLATAEKNIQEVRNVQEEIKRIDADTAAPEVVPPAATGDSVSRIERLNKLHKS